MKPTPWFNSVNPFTRKGAASERAAKAFRNMPPCSKSEAIEALASDYDLRGMVFDLAVKAGVIEWDAAAKAWRGTKATARTAQDAGATRMSEATPATPRPARFWERSTASRGNTPPPGVGSSPAPDSRPLYGEVTPNY